MKTLYYSTLLIGCIFLLLAFGGGTVFKGIITNVSEYSLKKSGVQVEYVHQVDSKIDDILYQVKKVQYQVDRVRSFFSENKPDESQYRREQNKIIETTVYNPLLDVTSFFVRVFLFLLGCMTLMMAFIIYLMRKFRGLFRRVRHLEKQLNVEASY